MKKSEFFRQPALILTFLNLINREMTTSKLAKEFKVYQGNMAKVIKRFEKLGLISKEPGKNKKEINIVLSKKGKRLAENIQKIKRKID